MRTEVTMETDITAQILSKFHTVCISQDISIWACT